MFDLAYAGQRAHDSKYLNVVYIAMMPPPQDRTLIGKLRSEVLTDEKGYLLLSALHVLVFVFNI